VPEQELFQKILGDVVANEEYGLVMRKWRELFNVTQAEIASELKVKPSVISDYESSRRKSPGITFIRTYVETIMKLRKEEARRDVNKQLDLIGSDERLVLYNFKKTISSEKLVKKLKAKTLTKSKELGISGSVVFFDNISKLLMNIPTY
jgi:putative transcriptional regulator